MHVYIKVTVLGKIIIPWTKDGKEYKSYALNEQQNGGQIVGQIRVPEEIYNTVEVGKEYILEGIYGTGKNGGYIRITEICSNFKMVQA